MWGSLAAEPIFAIPPFFAAPEIVWPDPNPDNPAARQTPVMAAGVKAESACRIPWLETVAAELARGCGA